ncbi:MAG: hypothetical protein JWQ38_2390 [Flavipsychrobacter sp.]|nr:hypothetical protein [Flavipsychrobacter sp.]
MKQAQLNRYCDEVLRLLYKNEDHDPLLFGVGEFRTEEKIANDLFVKIKLSEEDTKVIIQTLEGVYKFIETDAREKSTYYDLEKKENINSAIFAVRLTDAGKYFVQTSSFSKEARWKKINRWIPNVPNIVSLSAVLISAMACVICFVDNRDIKRAMKQQKEELLQNINNAQARPAYAVDTLTINHISASK